MNDVKYWKDKLNSIMIEGRGVARGGGSVTKRTEVDSDSPSQSTTSSSSSSVPTIPPAAVSDEQMKTLKIPAVQRKSATTSSNVSASTSVPPAIPTLPPSNVSQGSGNPVLPSPAPSSAPTATAVSPTVSAATTSGASVKPRIEKLPGETVAQAIARIKANAPTLVTPAEPTPNVWRDARNPRYTGLGQTQTAPAPVDPLSMPRQPEYGYGRPEPETQSSKLKNFLSRFRRSAGDEYTNLYSSPVKSGSRASMGTTPVQDRDYITKLQSKLAKFPDDKILRGELERMQRFYPPEIKEASMSSASKKSTGPKFPGYWRGDDPASAARSKMVGSVEESVQHRASILMNKYKNFKSGK